MYAAARDRLGPGRTLAVGDRLDIDIAGARRAGLDSALVLTGGTTREEADAADPRPTHVADSLAALVLGSGPHASTHAAWRPLITAWHRPRPLEIPEGFLRVCVLPSGASDHQSTRVPARGTTSLIRLVIEGSVCLIVNPHAGGGRALRLLPGVEAALRWQGRPFRVAETMSMQHARELAREACDNGEICAAMGGDGIVGAVAGELRDGAGLLVVLPGGRGNDFARKLGHPVRPGGGGGAAREPARRSGSTSPRPSGTTYLGILSAGIDSDVSRIALETRLKLGTFVYTYGVLRAIAGWKQAAWDADDRRRAGVVRRLLGRGGELRRVRRRDVPGARRRARRRPARDRHDLRQSKFRYLRGLPRVFNGSHLKDPAVTLVQAKEITFHADRPFTAYADGDPIGDLPLTVRCCRARCGWWRRDDPARRRRGRRQGGRHARAHRRARRRDVAARARCSRASSRTRSAASRAGWNAAAS